MGHFLQNEPNLRHCGSCKIETALQTAGVEFRRRAKRTAEEAALETHVVANGKKNCPISF